MPQIQDPITYIGQPIYHVVERLPPFISRWLGHRKETPPPEPMYVSYIWPFIGAFGGLSVIQAVFGYSQYFIDRGVPPVVPSFGASAVLCYGAISVPLAQPRALIGGHFISALVGVIVSVIFDSKHHPETHWVAASLATAIAIVAMQVTKTTHPPAGATALIPIVNAEVNALGWYYLPVILLSSAIILATALLTNNVQRRYPTFWWTAQNVIAPSKAAEGGGGVDTAPEDRDVEKGQKSGSGSDEESQRRSSNTEVGSRERSAQRTS